MTSGTALLCYLCCQRMTRLPSNERSRQSQLLWWSTFVVLALLSLEIVSSLYPREKTFLFDLFFGTSLLSDPQINIIALLKETVTALATFILLVALLIQKKSRKLLPMYLGFFCLLTQIALDAMITRSLHVKISIPWLLSITPLLLQMLGTSFIAFSTIKQYHYLLTRKVRHKRRRRTDNPE
ncbi:MAG: hypothetical protein VKL42_18655 [Snowella sp.]|nr:hypothetical protein [Snowella sp.]